MSNYSLSKPVNENDHMQGGPEAKITLVEYGDYECPHCGRAYPIVKQLQQDFGSDLRFVFRNFPLSQIHQNAMNAAISSEIAGDYGKYWEMHDILFENQRNLGELSLVSYASQLGIHEDEFAKKLLLSEHEELVKDDFMSGVRSGVNGTPSFFINGEKYSGDWSYNSLKQVLSSVLVEGV